MNDIQSFQQHITTLIFFGIVSFVVMIIAAKRSFFQLGSHYPKMVLSLKQFAWLVIGYLFIVFLITPMWVSTLMSLLSHQIKQISPSSIEWIAIYQASSMCFLTMYFWFIFKIKLNPSQLRLMWKATNQSSFYNFGLGMLIWLLSFPLVSFFYELAEILNIVLFGRESPEQSAVIFIKQSLANPLAFTVAIFSVIIAAPFIEEIIFRGFFHGYLRQRIGRKATILLSSLVFAFFHFSFRQEIGNFPLLLSIFTFAIFLGFIYERQKTLWASIGLHMAFNTISVIRILLTK